MNFTIEIASVPDRDDIVAEIWWGDVMVAELHRGASGAAEIEIYPAESQASWSFDLANWLSVLAEAQRKLG
jgi:hypothetical protein